MLTSLFSTCSLVNSPDVTFGLVDKNGKYDGGDTKTNQNQSRDYQMLIAWIVQLRYNVRQC